MPTGRIWLQDTSRKCTRRNKCARYALPDSVQQCARVRACIKKCSGTSVPISLHQSEYVCVRPIPCTSVPVRALPFVYGSLHACAYVLGHIIVNADASMGRIVHSPDASFVQGPSRCSIQLWTSGLFCAH